MSQKIITKYGVLTVTDHDSKHKMSGFQSLNTSVSQNKFCQKMRTCESTVCSKCYASTMLKRYKTMELNSIENGRILSENLFKIEDMPYINAKAFRLHSTGELMNNVHFMNYITLALKNPNTIFTLWTKRVSIVDGVLDKCERPSNLILIYSSPVLNIETAKPKNFDKTFTVFDKYTAEDEVINCGIKKCSECMLCYTHNNVTVIKELKK